MCHYAKQTQTWEDKEPLTSYMSKGVAALSLRHSSFVQSHSFSQGHGLLEIQRGVIGPGSALFRQSSCTFARAHCKYKQTSCFLRSKQVHFFFPNLKRKAALESNHIISFLATVSYFQFRTYWVQKNITQLRFWNWGKFLGEITKKEKNHPKPTKQNKSIQF